MAKSRPPTEADEGARNPVVARALKFFKMVSKAETDQRQKELEDLEFEAGEHWHPKVKADRDANGEPCVTVDLLSGPLNQIEGQAQESRAGITLGANKPGTAPEAAGLLQGFARNIEQQSGATDVYQHAVRRCSRAGRAGWRILPEYESDDTFDQVLRIKWVDNWHCVYLAPAKEQDGSDRTQALIVEDMTHDQYLARFGDHEKDTLSESLGASMQSIGDTPADWLTNDRVRVAEYMEIKTKARTLLKLEYTDPTTKQVQRKEVYADQLPKGEQTRRDGKFAAGAPVLPPGWTQINSRKVSEKTCCWYFINAIEPLEESIWPIPYIPVIEIEGERRNINGKIDQRGVVRMGKELNRMADYHETAIIEEVDAARSAPWLVEWSQIEGFEDEWENPKGKRVLHYRKVSGDNGAPLPPPIRNFGEPAIQGSVIAAQRSEQLLRNVTGVPDIFANETQAQQNNQSGKAVLARQRQQEVGNSKYLVSRNRGIAYTGKILLAWMPSIYDTPRHHRVKDLQEKERSIITHKGQPDHAQRMAQQFQVKPEDVVDLAQAAKYDVAATVGKSYPTQRAETVELITSAMPALPPPLIPKALAIVFKNSDGPGMQEMAAAFEPDKKQQGVPIEQAQQAQQVIDQLSQTVHTLQDQIDSKKVEVDSKERIALADIEAKKLIAAAQEETKRLIAQIQTEQKDALAALEGIRETLQQHREHAHAVGMAGMQAVHGEAQAQQAHEQQLEAGEVGHAQALEAGEQGHQHAVAQIKAQPKPTNGAKK